MRNLKRSALIALIVAPVAIGVPALAFADTDVDQIGESIVRQDIDQEQDNETDQENSNRGRGLTGESDANVGRVDQRNDNATDQDQRADERAESGDVDQDQRARSDSSTLLPVPALPPVPAVPVVPVVPLT